MLRVATNVVSATGSRAIGTYIPAVGATADRTATDVDSARNAARELDQLSGELTRLINVFTV
jgi:methyl-accepting chemotaxis protein